MMTKQDYEGIASVLASEYAIRENLEARLALRSVTYSLADKFARSNPNFKRALFYWKCETINLSRTCGYEGCGRQMHPEVIRNEHHPDFGKTLICCDVHGSQYVLEDAI